LIQIYLKLDNGLLFWTTLHSDGSRGDYHDDSSKVYRNIL